MSSRPRLLLLDGHSLAYRAFHALPEENFSTTTGQPTNAVYGFTSMLLNVLRDERPTHAAVAFDVSRKTFRSERYPDYKATRSASPPSFRGQVDLIREVLGTMRIAAFEAEGFEVETVGDGQAALSRLAGDGPAFDLVILDLGLPRLDGLEVLRRLRARKNPLSQLLVHDPLMQRVLIDDMNPIRSLNDQIAVMHLHGPQIVSRCG